MNNFLRHRKNAWRIGRQTKIFFAILVLTVFAGSIHVLSPGALSRPLHLVASPLWRIETTAETRAAEYLALLKSKRALVLRNRALTSRIDAGEKERAELALLRKENETLKALLGRGETQKRVLSAVLVAPNTSLYDTLVIDIGEQNGVMVGNRVFAFGTIPIGEVSRVFLNTSLVTLFSSPGMETPVLLGPSGIRTTARGRGAGNFEARLPRQTEVSTYDTVTIPGIGSGPFAVVEKVIEYPTDPFQTILFKNPINQNELEWVEVAL